ncbi:hypothetical protein [Marinilactibacillus piezotolerans]|uniref:hypothetical protein n=1 Tax=Marinilactibacillus piezotolerans TaxID=258723 RepID=UPI0009B0049C|nr:hypothetical protein [Marinilactibacillus piezotolerans]
MIDLNYEDMDEQTHLNALNELDRYEQYLWIRQLKNTSLENQTNFFTIECFEDLKLIQQLNAREIEFCTIHFIEMGIAIRGTFDMAMEVFFKDGNTVAEIAEEADKHDLFLREYPEDLEFL